MTNIWNNVGVAEGSESKVLNRSRKSRFWKFKVIRKERLIGSNGLDDGRDLREEDGVESARRAVEAWEDGASA